MSGIAEIATAASFATNIEKISAVAKQAASKPLRKYFASIRTTFGDHLESSFQRCTRIKTILNSQEPVSLIDQYVSLDFATADGTLEDLDVISQIRSHKRAIISGSGGGGKTIFMKYLWISFFQDSSGKIPIFVELRRLNDLKLDGDDLLLFIFNDVVRDPGEFSRAVFDAAIRNGRFTFIFDGFDEVLHSKRAAIERQILELCDLSPENIVVVSGRVDERFDSWQQFTKYTVCPLNKKKVISLIDNLKYDETSKRKFIDRVRKDLFEAHQSFLSSPLLVTIMLMTFNEYADIPEKVHVFYQQAFDTLYSRHDSKKEIFRREMYASLSPDEFKKFFSYFCLITYYRGKVEFSHEELIEQLRTSFALEKRAIDAEAFLKDLTESTCLLQRDGLRYIFTHRSFQEYFVAYCLAYVSQSKIADLLREFALRQSDTMIAMLYDMNRRVVDEHILIPGIRGILESCGHLKGLAFVKAYHSLIGACVRILSVKMSSEGAARRYSNRWHIIVSPNNTNSGYADAYATVIIITGHLAKTFASHLQGKGSKKMKGWRDLDHQVGKRFLKNIAKAGREALVGSVQIYPVQETSSKIPADIVLSTGYYEYTLDLMRAFSEILQQIESLHKAKNDLMDQLLAERLERH